MSRSEPTRPWKTIRSVVADDKSVLGALARRVDELRRCEESLKGYLDLPGAESLRVAAIEGGALIVIVDSAARGARLRFLAPQIVARASRSLGRSDLDRLEIRIRPKGAVRGHARSVNESTWRTDPKTHGFPPSRE